MVMALGWLFDLMILKVFSDLNDFMILKCAGVSGPAGKLPTEVLRFCLQSFFKRNTWQSSAVSLPSTLPVECFPSQSKAARISSCGSPDLAAYAGTQADFHIWHRLIMCLALLCFVCEGTARGQVPAKKFFAAWHRFFPLCFYLSPSGVFPFHFSLAWYPVSDS